MVSPRGGDPSLEIYEKITSDADAHRRVLRVGRSLLLPLGSTRATSSSRTPDKSLQTQCYSSSSLFCYPSPWKSCLFKSSLDASLVLKEESASYTSSLTRWTSSKRYVSENCAVKFGLCSFVIISVRPYEGGGGGRCKRTRGRGRSWRKVTRLRATKMFCLRANERNTAVLAPVKRARVMQMQIHCSSNGGTLGRAATTGGIGTSVRYS